MDNIQAGGEQFIHCKEVVPYSECPLFGCSTVPGNGAQYDRSWWSPQSQASGTSPSDTPRY